jgi:ABC-2 type transport system permease protein
MTELFRNNQLWQLTKANFLEKIREPSVLFWGIGFPILMAIGLGMAFSSKPDMVRHVALISTMQQTDTLFLEDEQLGNSTFILERMDWEEAMRQLKRGHVNVILETTDSGFVYHFDPVNADAQLTYLKLTPLLKSLPTSGFAEREEKTATISTDSYLKHLEKKEFLHDNVMPLTITGTRYIDFFIPGLITMGVMFSCMWGLGYNIIENRSKKLLRRMIATPMKRSNYLIAMISVRLLMNIVEAGLLIVFAWLVFGITIQGSIPALLLIFLAGNIAFAGIGILMACRTSKTEVGNGLINVVTMPMMVLSGIFFSYHNFPDWLIPIIKPLPLTMMTDGVRAIFIEGAGFAQVALPSLILGITGFVFFVLGLKWFKWH